MSSVSFALRYTTRSLRRGGQRTVLALFCIAVGVMAVVALRLAGDMITVSLTSNLREVLGGDIDVQSNAVPLTPDQLTVLDALKSQGRIQGYAALGTFTSSVHREGGLDVQLQLFVVDDPAHFPLVDASPLEDPAGASESAAIAARGSIVLGGFAAEELSAHAGDSVTVALARGGAGGSVKVGGVLAPRVTAGNPAQAYISRDTYSALGGGAGADQFGLVEVVVGGSSTDIESVATSIRQAIPQASTTTIKDALDEATQSSQDVDSALEVTGLLALLIGGIGVANTMQVSLRRRRVEVAMLKSAGYRRGRLVTLFGVEAALLGLGGGVVGSLLGIGVADIVRILVQRAFYIDVPFSISTATVASGFVVGVVTALIFGLLPIVRAAAVRPVVVLRDGALAPTLASGTQSALLYGVLVVAFAALAASLIGSVLIAVIVIVLGVLVLGILAGLFWVTVWLVGLVPVPERPRPLWLGASLLALAAAGGVAAWLGPIGWVLVGVAT
ncbi:MAG TPA: FtsX-like permease family protein, partial [Candidatus Dormibacteraeota bacterium]|nr:FtsX-like permease family protein [Candidatus Dormibacteraeota bacterium]